MGQELNEKLSKIQKELKAPKSKFNSFGKYNYRNCEDILESVKPHLDNLTLTISDDIVLVGTRIYVKATAMLSDGVNTISVSAFAREAETRKGMDDSQNTGSSSSYARKYALNGLFCIDDTKDADHGAVEEIDTEAINEGQLSVLIDLLLASEADEIKFLKYMGFESLADIPKNRFHKAKTSLEAKLKVAK